MIDILVTILGVVLLIIAWVTLYDSNRFVIRNYTVTDNRIKKRGRAVVLADLHNKRYGKDNERLLGAIRAQKPDFILIAGDMITAKPGKSLEPALKLLRELKKDYPIYYGNGNHEHRLKLYPRNFGRMAEEYGHALAELGIEPLVNSLRVLTEHGISIYGAEIDRAYFKRFHVREMSVDYLDKVLGKPAKDRYTVLLAHNPDYFPQYAAWGADLVISGHVHGGVARVPILGKGVISPSLRPFPKYDGGVFQETGAVMILSRGLGMHTIHVRFFNPGELWVVDFEGEV